MWRSRILLATSAAALASCSDGSGSCGTSGGTEFGLVASGPSVMLTYGDVVAMQNNDCPDPNAPAGVVSLTLTAMEMGTSGFVTLCIPRPDLLETASTSLGSGVEVVDFTGADTSCSYMLDMTVPPSGTVSSHGMCNNGSDSAGFVLDFSGTVSLMRTCVAVDTVSVSLDGDVEVMPGS